MDPFLLQQSLLAVGIIVLAMVMGRIVTNLTLRLNKQLKFSSLAVRRTLRFFRMGLFLVSLVLALVVLQVEFAMTLWENTLLFLPSFFVLIILWLLGYAVISLIIDFVGYILLQYADEYLNEFGVTRKSADVFFFLVKLILLLVFAAISLRVTEINLPIVNMFLIGIVLAFLLFAVAILIYAFKDYLANFLLSTYVSKHILKPGQYVRIDDEVGEVVTVNNHGAVLSFTSGYKRVIPNTKLVRKDIVLKQTRSDIHKLEPLLKRYIVQLPSHCGPASAAMMLNFFGYTFSQEELAKAMHTRVRGKKDRKKDEGEYGTEPDDLINAVKKFTKSQVRGKLILYDEIDDLREEVKIWLTEGALLILWYKKPVLFPQKQSKTGHYVLGVGVEDDSVIVMDPSRQTAGVYMVNHVLMEEAMSQTDKKRGYIVFAKKGSPAFWRLTEGLYYADTAAYEESLSKSFERYLKKTMRESSVVKEFISPFVELFFEPDEEKVKHLWKPDLGKEKRRKRNA